MSIALVKYKLHEVAELIRGVTFNKSDSQDIHSSGRLPVIRAGNIQSELILDRNLVWIPKTKIKQNQVITKNDIVMCTSSGSASLVGKCAIAESDWNGSFGAFCLGIRPIISKCSPSYLLHYLHCPIFTNWSQNSSGANIKNIRKSEIENFSITLPPLPVQHKIATILDTAEALKQKDKALMAKYDELSQSLFLDMFGDPVTNPKGWERRSIGDVCLKIVDCVNRTAPTVDYETDYKMIRTTNVRNHKINTAETRFVNEETYTRWTRRLVPKKGDIVFTREAPVGEAGIIETDEKIFLGQRTMEYRSNNIIVSPTFLLYELMGSNIQRQLNRLSSGSTVKHLSVPDCKKFKVNIPPIDLQNQFAARIQAIEQQKQQAQASLQKSEDLFNCLLQKAFKGELVC